MQWKYDEFDEAVKLATRYSGYGHSCGRHSTNQENIMRLAAQAKASRMIVRQTQA